MSNAPSNTQRARTGVAMELWLVLGALLVLAFGLGYVTGGVVARADEPQAVAVTSTNTIINVLQAPRPDRSFPDALSAAKPP